MSGSGAFTALLGPSWNAFLLNIVGVASAGCTCRRVSSGCVASFCVSGPYRGGDAKTLMTHTLPYIRNPDGSSGGFAL
jgi:hypothetical protein